MILDDVVGSIALAQTSLVFDVNVTGVFGFIPWKWRAARRPPLGAVSN